MYHEEHTAFLTISHMLEMWLKIIFPQKIHNLPPHLVFHSLSFYTMTICIDVVSTVVYVFAILSCFQEEMMVQENAIELKKRMT